ncbi:endoribonuclease Dicer homolog 2 isoform X2 [Cryptomeria japonica]|uniref:endoribonuclease Dicer homolog 2 isoform X2 n=1 Tax=Cryptomeria japonica TaxID=3369 RepID=UPI0027DA8443|nr:endoribonuclease Dicer homolog 2 isoform X2 [Cryptomeria japonica]
MGKTKKGDILMGIRGAKRLRQDDNSSWRPGISSPVDLADMDLRKPDPESFARRYQLEVLRKAIDENTIAYLDTGAGKTLIAVMLIRSYAHLIRKPQNNIAVFMVPTVILVRQQAEVLKMHTDLKVGQYWGDMGVDFWDSRKWKKELETHEVFVMTPQIFLDNLRHCHFHFKTVRLMIFDECHHARKNTPYACIMNEFYHRKSEHVKNLPRIFGMTASPVSSSGTSSSNCAAEVQQLETILNAKVYTLEDTAELERVLAYPDLKRNYYDSAEVPYSLLQKFRIELEHIQYKHTQFESNDIYGGSLEKARKKIGKLYLNILYCAEEMGIWCASKDALNVCNKFLPSDKSWRCGKNLNGDVVSGYLSPKIQCLIQSLLEYRDWKQVRCIVFVTRVIAAIVLGNLLGYLDCFSGFKTEYIVGSQIKLQAQTRRQQTEIVDAFRDGKVNIIVATSVLEEGFDIKGCNLVIRYDFSDTMCSFIQSRGRARMQDSDYVFLVKRDDVEEERKIDNYIKSEQTMRDVALNRTRTPYDLHAESMPNMEVYCVESTQAIVSLNSSVALIHYYCSQLPGDRYYTPRPTFYINKEIGECIMELPRNCPVLTVKVQGKCNMLKQVACLEACKKLHVAGALTDNLVPAKEKEEEEEEEEEEEDDEIGIEKGREDCKVPYPLYVPNKLVGEWDLDMAKVPFHCYILSFRGKFSYCVPFCNVLLLSRQKFDTTVESMLIQLETTHGGVDVQSAYCGSLDLTSHEVEIARKFQVTVLGLLMDQKLDKLNERINKTGKPNMMYLLLPVLNTTFQGLASSIDWACIKKASFHEIQSHEKISNNNRNCVHTAFGTLPLEMLQNSLVETPHNGRLYYVTDVSKDLNANSTMVSAKVTIGQMKTYIQHFREQYDINIKFPGQLLLCARTLFSVRNFLLRRPQVEKDTVTNAEVHLPPELCNLVSYGIPISVLYTFSYLPSVMHRIESVLSAAQLQKIFSSNQPYNISTFKVLEALTSKKCQECMSLESLETLGDAFLKYVSSRHLFTAYAQKHEGQLTSKRKRIISNYALCKFGCDRNLPGYMHDEPFNPKKWIIPGEHIPSSRQFCQDTSDSMKNLYVKAYRLLKLKKIADVVEALIGAFLICAGEIGAVNFIKWIGMNIDLPSKISITNNLDKRIPTSVNISHMESLLHYSFHNRNLLVEAMTHASYQVPWVSGCYQRLEFLGDAVLDYVITLYLYNKYPGLTPGVLTDLKSAAVNNDCYAQAAAKWNLHQHLLHASNPLHRQITNFVQLIGSSSESTSHSYGWFTGETEAPKVLGDMIESIAGAIFVDSGFNTEIVWTAMKPLLEPIVTPETLCYHPVRELQELCQKENYEWSYNRTEKQGKCCVEVQVNVGNSVYTETCDAANKKTAKKLAAEKVLIPLKGISNQRR